MLAFGSVLAAMPFPASQTTTLILQSVEVFLTSPATLAVMSIAAGTQRGVCAGKYSQTAQGSQRQPK